MVAWSAAMVMARLGPSAAVSATPYVTQLDRSGFQRSSIQPVSIATTATPRV